MELRQAEQEMDNLTQIYQSLCSDSILCRETLPVLTMTTSTPPAEPSTQLAPPRSSSSAPPTVSTPSLMIASSSTAIATIASRNDDSGLSLHQSIWQRMKDLVHRLEGLQTKVDRFRKRASEKDPVTDLPRYGQNTLERVNKLIGGYEEMMQAVQNSGIVQVDPTVRKMAVSHDSWLVQQIRTLAQQEEEEKSRLEQEAIMSERRAQEIKEQEERQKLQREKLAQEAARRQEEEQRQEVARAAEAERLAQRQKQEEADRADREWVASITRGPQGVREQLDILLQSTIDDPVAQTTALRSLHTLFAQIVARPEEINFRRIRRDHPRFQDDVGRHPGGRELLIAAGFELGLVDQVPTFLSREPDLETDMDRWSSWFELHKAALEIIKAHL